MLGQFPKREKFRLYNCMSVLLQSLLTKDNLLYLLVNLPPRSHIPRTLCRWVEGGEGFSTELLKSFCSLIISYNS